MAGTQPPLPSPPGDLPVLPEVTVQQCRCPGQRTRLNSMIVLLSCADCGEPQMRIEGCPAHLAEIITALVHGGD